MRLVFGELSGSRARAARLFFDMCQKAGFDVTLCEQILTDLWMKFVLLATNASVTALDPPADRPAARRSRHAAAVRRRRTTKCIAVGPAPRASRCRTTPLDTDAGFNADTPATMKASMALDLERGNRIELPWLGGKVVELGRQLGVPTPTHGMMYALLKPYTLGTPG